MEIRVLQENELANAAGLSRFVFDNCLRMRMEFPQTIAFVEDYIKEPHLRTLVSENKLVIWGAFENNQIVGIGGLQSDGMITMLYVLPQFWRRGIGAQLLSTMRAYARTTYRMESVIVNATPAWTSGYFAKQDFRYLNMRPNAPVPFVGMTASSATLPTYPKRRLSGKVIALSITGCLVFTTLLGILYMMFYLF